MEVLLGNPQFPSYWFPPSPVSSFSFCVFPVFLLSKAPQAAFEEQDSRHGHLSVACNDDISISGGDVGYWNHNVRVGSSVLNRLIFGPFL